MTPASPVLSALRQATAPAHRHIESVVGLHRLSSRQAHARLLSAWCAFHLAWEPQVPRALPAALHGWLARRSRLAWLQQDLLALGQPLPPPAPLRLQLGDAPAAWGSLYVVEGSTLGGQLIARHLRESLGIGLASGGRYHAGHGAATAALWRDCCAQLDAALDPARGAPASALPAACRAAVRTFEELTACLQEACHEQPALA